MEQSRRAMKPEIIVVVRFFALLRDELGISELKLRLKGSTVLDLIKALRERLGSKAFLILREERFKEGLLIAINDELICDPDLAKRKLKNGYIIDIMPPPSGG